MWSHKRLSVLLLICLLLHDAACGRRPKKSKRTKNEEDETTPQPDVVTYSTFGFNDVGPTYDGFVPSSPDYATYLSNYNQETSTRLYAPAFPTAVDNSPYNFYGQQTADGSFGTGSDNEPQTSMLQYQHNYNLMNSNYDGGNSENLFQSMPDEVDKNADDFNSVVYGAKINSRNRNRPSNSYNSSITFGTENNNAGNEGYSSGQEGQAMQESKPIYGESAHSHFNMYNYAPTYPSPVAGDDAKSSNTKDSSASRFQKGVDFSKYKPSYPTELENKPSMGLSAYASMSNTNENSYTNNYDSDNESPSSRYRQTFNYVNSDNGPVPIGTNYLDISINHIDDNNNKNHFKNSKLYNEYKDQFKTRSPNITSDISNWRNAFKGFDFGNNGSSSSSTSFRYDYSGKKLPKGNTDEVGSASNNVADFTNYRFPDIDPGQYSNFKKFPNFKAQTSENYPSLQSYKYQDGFNQGDEYFNQYKNSFSTVPSTTSHWGNYFKNSDFSSSYTKNSEFPSSYTKSRLKKPQHSDENSDEVVHIPKRHKYHISKHHGNRYKGRPLSEWNKEVSTRFKSEEDLLGLRNHDTSHPPYLPNFKLNNDIQDEFDKYAAENSYKNLVEKWRQSYLKSKLKFSKELKDSFKDSYTDYEGYGSESKPVHVPVPKPYPIEIPHPVIVPVPQPYPVRVPVPKPVAVPVIREIKLPIEKPVPYPVIKKVPYPIEKLVPVPVEKEVPVAVMKPYPVPIPHVRPVFHHSKPSHSHEDLDSDPESSMEEDTYYPRPERPEPSGKKYVRYVKKTRSSRNRSRRPPSSHYDRNRRRWPARRPSTGFRRDLALARARRPRPSVSIREYNYAPSYKEYEEDYD